MDNVEKLLNAHDAEDERRFREISRRLENIELALKELSEFKAEMVYSAKGVSIVVGSLFGFASLVASSVVAYFLTYKFH